MISRRFRQNLASWQAFLTMSKPQQRQYVRDLKLSQIEDLEELFFNILRGNVIVEPLTLERLRKHKSRIKIIGQKRIALKHKKNIIQSGQGAALISLGLSLLPTILSMLQK